MLPNESFLPNRFLDTGTDKDSTMVAAFREKNRIREDYPQTIS